MTELLGSASIENVEEEESQGEITPGGRGRLVEGRLEAGVGVGRRGSDAVGGHPTAREGRWGCG